MKTAAGMETLVAMQGDHGCFSETAARRALGTEIRPVSCRSFDEVAASVRSGTADYGVLPISNSIAGPVQAARAALEGQGFATVATLVLPIEQCLLVLPGTPIAALRRVISHPVALAQCGLFLAKHPMIVPEAVWDTAGAARHVAAQQDSSLAAIAGREAAACYGLDLAATAIGDHPDNATTFVIVTQG